MCRYSQFDLNFVKLNSVTRMTFDLMIWWKSHLTDLSHWVWTFKSQCWKHYRSQQNRYGSKKVFHRLHSKIVKFESYHFWVPLTLNAVESAGNSRVFSKIPRLLCKYYYLEILLGGFQRSNRHREKHHLHCRSLHQSEAAPLSGTSALWIIFIYT